jgi:hypothetical protein
MSLLERNVEPSGQEFLFGGDSLGPVMVSNGDW